MAELRGPTPRFLPVLKMHCPYCGVAPLRNKGAWFTFAQGCKACDYRYEREEGYYTGASWMICFPVVVVTGFGLAALLYWLLPAGSETLISVLASVYMLVLGALFMPFSMALWLYFEHHLHPLDADDKFELDEMAP